MLALPTPGLSAPTHLARCAPQGCGGPQVAFPYVARVIWGHSGTLGAPTALCPPLPCILLGFHMDPTFSKVKWG